MEKSLIPGWKTESEAQAMLNVRQTSLWRWRKFGLLKWSRVGRRIFYQEASILAFIESNIQNSES